MTSKSKPATTLILTEVISDRSWGSERNDARDRKIVGRVIVGGEHYTLQLHVHVDPSYDFQSRASAEVWQPGKGWCDVHSIPGVLVGRDITRTMHELARVAIAVLEAEIAK